MGMETKQECLEKTRLRYRGAGRKHKKIILDEFCATRMVAAVEMRYVSLSKDKRGV